MQLTDIKQGNIKDGVITLSCGEAIFCYLCQTSIDPLVCNPIAFNHLLSEPSAAQQPAHPDLCVPVRLHRCRVYTFFFTILTLVWLSMQITHVFNYSFFKPWLWEGRDRLVLQWKAVRCQHSNSRLEFMCLQPKSWESQWHQTRKMHSPTRGRQGSLPEMAWKKSSWGSQSSAYQHWYSYGFLDKCTSGISSNRQGMKKKKITELHIAFRDCSQRKKWREAVRNVKCSKVK